MPLDLDVLPETQEAGSHDVGPDERLDHVRSDGARLVDTIDGDPAGEVRIQAAWSLADRLFTTSGPADVSLRAIAREADVNHGMLHRHFGTRDDLVDSLLDRMATKWTAQTQATGDFTSAVDSILGPPDDAEASAGSWIRLLAWSLLTDAPGRFAESQRRYATLDLLPGMLDEPSPRTPLRPPPLRSPCGPCQQEDGCRGSN